METLTTHARNGGLVIFAGAGISMPPPSSLPSWYLINEVVLESLAQRLEPFAGRQFSEEVRQQLIATRNDKTRHFSPDYHAQIIEDECGPDYFRVLQALDADEWNGCHSAIAALAKGAFVAAVVTTNFDCLLERALDAASVQYRVYRKREEYDSWRIGESPLAIVKVHGSVQHLESMVDTLRQRLMGRPESLERGLIELLKRHHVLFAGFSGADLAYDEGYLGLRAAAKANRGFTCLLRPGDEPTAGMASLKKAWGDNARYLKGELPGWFEGLLGSLQLTVPKVPVVTAPSDRIAALRTHADRWSSSLGHMLAVAIMAELLESSGRPQLAYQLLVKTYNSAGEIRDPEAPGYARYNYQLGRRLLEQGNFDCPVDPYYGRKARREGYDPFTANDCFQCLHRGTTGNFADGLIAMGLYEALRGYPENGAERLRSVRKRAQDLGAILPFVDACRTLAIVYEILMKYSDALEWLELAHKYARRIGDEPRRARVCAELARFLAAKQQFEKSHERLREGNTIAQRLDLRVAQMELWSSEASVLVEERRGMEAKALLERVLPVIREATFRPLLLRTLIDAGYASYETRDQALLDRVYDEIYDLVDRYPSYAPLVALMNVRLAKWTGDAESARRNAQEAKRLGKLYQNPAAVELAGRLVPE
jgi:tetratricopeptide (TPR) repeat protein